MDEKKVLAGLIEAHQLLRHDFMNNLQVISGYQQIGQPEKANEYILKTTNFLRRFNGLGKIKIPLLKGLIIMYLTQYNDLFPAFNIQVGSELTLSQEEEAELVGLLHRVMGVLEQPLQKGELSCQILLGTEQDGLLCFILEGQLESLRRAQEEVFPLLKNIIFRGDLLQKGNTIQVKILLAN